MILRCVTNKVSDLPARGFAAPLEEYFRGVDLLEGVDVGACYPAVALETGDGDGWWAYLDVLGLPFPTPFPLEAFEVVDSAPRPGWRIGVGRRSARTGIDCLSFVEWVEDPSFYERLVEMEDDAVATYDRWQASQG